MTAQAPSVSVLDGIATYPLLSALTNRRSRRFARGATLDSGPLAFQSVAPPEPLTLAEEAALVFAATGITGYTLAELPYTRSDQSESGCGNIIVNFVGRTVPSGDALHTAALFVLNDAGTWLIRRPQDLEPAALAAIIDDGREGRLVEAYQRMRVQLSSRRASIPQKVPLVPPFNIWDANLPGTTYFIPVVDFTALYINVLLTAFGDELGYFIVDDHNGYKPAGLAPFARSRGGHLFDDPGDGRVMTVGFLETALATIAGAEEGAMHQSLGLMAEALGIGGFTHACRHPEWLKALGFDVATMPFSRTAGWTTGTRLAMRLLHRHDPLVDVPTGLRTPGQDGWLLWPFCPPRFPTMRAAVLAFVDYKFGASDGTLTSNRPAAWLDPATIRRQIAPYAPAAIAATTAYCEYLHRRYGRFPQTLSPYENHLAYQAHHLDASFYDRFYQPDVLPSRQRTHHHD
jgi:hypothetical protein